MMKILVLTSSTGGGHDMRARSLKAWAEQSQAGSLQLEVNILQTLEQTHGLYRFGVGLYNWIQRTWPLLHHIYFNVLELLSLHRKSSSILGREAFIAQLQEFQPDVVVSTHAHLNHGFFALVKEAIGPNNVQCVTYCGELFGGYGFSRHWVNPDADAFIGAVAETQSAAEVCGMDQAKNHVGGFMLNPNFYEAPLSVAEQKVYVEKTLGLEFGKFILVLATGANSANNHILLLNEIYQSGLRPQVVALCGKSQAALQAVEAWGQAHAELPLCVLPYGELHQLFQVASAVVARPGTGTTSECILANCPIIFNCIGGVMPQEYITVKFMRSHNQERSIKQARDLPRVLRSLIEDETTLNEAKQKLQTLKPAQHPMDVLKKLVSLKTQPTSTMKIGETHERAR